MQRWSCEVPLCCQPLAAWPWVRIKQISCNLLSDPLPSSQYASLNYATVGSWNWKFKLHIKVLWKDVKMWGWSGERGRHQETEKLSKQWKVCAVRQHLHFYSLWVRLQNVFVPEAHCLVDCISSLLSWWWPYRNLATGVSRWYLGCTTYSPRLSAHPAFTVEITKLLLLENFPSIVCVFGG